ncbi:MAG: DUF169 domain-containing protein [Desulfovibrionaceae bacterium]|jgi:uncharacterized protein (DUF169 family)|nr:DUF169 domain-containing protein [Desulfovibrionaceae bacterium]
MAELTYAGMQELLMKELRLYHYPIAIKYFFKDEEIAEFEKNVEHFRPVKPMTFCQLEIAARMKGQSVLSGQEGIGCANAQFVFGWAPFSEKEVKSHLKYVKDMAQAERFVKTKPRLPEGTLKAIAVQPLADTYFDPDVVHFYCDNMQAYHLLVDYMSAMDVHPLHSNITMNSAACAGNVYTFNAQLANMYPACSGSYNAGKTERGEINVSIPGSQIKLVVERLMERMANQGSSSITRPGDGFPGADVCKNCPLIIFKPASKGE